MHSPMQRNVTIFNFVTIFFFTSEFVHHFNQTAKTKTSERKAISKNTNEKKMKSDSSIKTVFNLT